MRNIPKEPMAYKQYKQTSQLITKLRVIRRVLTDGWSKTDTAISFSCHRNTVINIVSAFETRVPALHRNLLLQTARIPEADILEMLSPLRDTSTKPHTHPAMATRAQQDRVRQIFSGLRVKVGPKRLRTILRRKYADSIDPLEKSLAGMGMSKLRTIYKREGFKTEKARATCGTRRQLYDYHALGCFEKMHFDTKHILDKKALPPAIYDYFSLHPGIIPRYEWNLIDAKSRFRITAYSHEINATFGLYFLIFAVGSIRTATNNWQTHIDIGQDNGMELCAGSINKADTWNRTLAELNASIYTYHPHFDIRKNLIERSHRSDDEEFFIARGEFIKNTDDFMREARGYQAYWNTDRSHSGIAMDNRTPGEVLSNSGMLGVHRLLEIPVLLLDRQIKTLQQIAVPLLFARDIREKQKVRKGTILDLKTLIDLRSRYFFTGDAQNVLTYYLSGGRLTNNN